MKNNFAFQLLFLLIAFNLLCVAVHGQAIGEQNLKKKIVCSTTQIADFAKNIVGNRWDVQSILGPGQDPHTHEVSAASAKLVSQADLCFQKRMEFGGARLDGKNLQRVRAKHV